MKFVIFRQNKGFLILLELVLVLAIVFFIFYFWVKIYFILPGGKGQGAKDYKSIIDSAKDKLGYIKEQREDYNAQWK